MLFHDLRELFRTDRHTVYFLGASALFRDGLTAVFTFGAVLAVTVYGINEADVLIFGVAANVVSAVGALVAGRFDDRLGPKIVIVVSLIGMLVDGGILLFLSGPTAFWVFGLLLSLFVGPGAVVVPDVPGAARAAGPRGPAVRAVRDHGPCGVVPRADAVRVLHPGLRHGPGGHRRHPAGHSGWGCSRCWPVRPPAARPTSAPSRRPSRRERSDLFVAAGHQPQVPGSPLNGPTTSSVIHPP